MAAKRFAATVSYDGEDFAGSQRQANRRTVQGELERALAALTGERTRVDLAGRTDAGVHARGQVAAFFLLKEGMDAATAGRALNAHLARDVAVRHVREVAEDFDPRRAARRRWYRYRVWNHPERDPLSRRSAWHVESPLDLRAMQASADVFVGRHDFRAACGPLESGRTSVRNVLRAGWCARDGALLFDIEADAFLPQMVRRIAGALIGAGRGAITKEELAARLEQAKRGTIGPTAPAHGLCLERVYYDEGYLP